MCGIIGYTGKEACMKKLIDALEMLEYRGYDSAGVALQTDSGVKIVKRAGRVAQLREECQRLSDKEKNTICGIGHTRWATHGGVTDGNAHPHQFGKVTMVHNGIIENYKELAAHYKVTDALQSETDSEVVAAVLDHYYQGDAYAAIRKTVLKLKGTFALVILFEDQPGVVYAVRNVSPIVATSCASGCYLASDVAALSVYTNEYFVVPEYHVLTMTEDGVSLQDMSGDPVEPDILKVDWDIHAASKGGFPFYMEKEIWEQPKVIKQTISDNVKDGMPMFCDSEIPDEVLKKAERIFVVACGTAMHAGMVAAALIRKKVRMHVDVQCASEFVYDDPIIDEKTLILVISQSGETIDTLAAMRYAQEKGAKAIAVINVKGASIAREADYVIYTQAGPEIAVASTKAYTTQVAILYLFAARLAYVRGSMSESETKEFVKELLTMPEVVSKVLKNKVNIHKAARLVLNAKDTFMIGRGMDYTLLLEASLKLKEISYIHSECYASGELKHGTIALIADNTPVIASITQDDLVLKSASNIKEVQSRGAEVILFAREDLELPVMNETVKILLPATKPEFAVFSSVVALQLFAYFVSSDKGLDVDKPRNLAKVVTVE